MAQKKKAKLSFLAIEKRAARLYTTQYPRAKGPTHDDVARVDQHRASNVVSFAAFRLEEGKTTTPARNEHPNQHSTIIPKAHQTTLDQYKSSANESYSPRALTSSFSKPPNYTEEHHGHDLKNESLESLAPSSDYIAPDYPVKAPPAVNGLLVDDTEKKRSQVAWPEVQTRTSSSRPELRSDLHTSTTATIEEHKQSKDNAYDEHNKTVETQATTPVNDSKSEESLERKTPSSTEMSRETETHVPSLLYKRSSVLSARVESLQSHYTRLQEEYETIITQQAAMKSQLKTIDGSLQNTQAQVSSNTKEISSLQDSRTALVEEMTLLRATVQDCQDELHSLHATVKSRSIRVSEDTASQQDIPQLRPSVEFDAEDDRDASPVKEIAGSLQERRVSEDFETLAIDVLAESGTAQPYRLSLPAGKYKFPASPTRSSFKEDLPVIRLPQRPSEHSNVKLSHRTKFTAIPKTKAASATHFLHFKKKPT